MEAYGKPWRRSAALAVAGVALLALPQSPAWSQSCIQEAAGRSIVCTANDVRVAFADHIRDVAGKDLSQCTAGETFSFIADFHVTVGATSRYDIGLFFATDGDPNADGARSGVCSPNIIKAPYLDPAGSGVMLGSAAVANLDGDACGDINTANGWGVAQGGKIVTVRVDNVLCKKGANGMLSLPNCTSWSQNSGVACSNPTQAAPGSPSKCSCDVGFTVPIFVEEGSITVTKDASPASLPEPGGEFTFTVGVTNTATLTSLTVDRICDDQFGTIAKVASATACTDGKIGSINSTNCDAQVGQTLAAGGSFSCTFKANVTGKGPKDVTDIVAVTGHDVNNKPVSGSDSAKVSITDVTPTATAVKTLVGLACADVDYRVRVNNTDSHESLTLSALSDNGFGDLTKTSSTILSTTCSLPQTLAASGSTTPPDFYECSFRAHFCGGSHTNTITATVDDGTTTISPTTNTLTVYTNASTTAPGP